MLEKTIRDNVVYGLLPGDFDEEVIRDVLHRCEAQTFYEETFTKQLDTKVRELSGGQSQRLGLARALLKNPSCCVLDEATSALDEITMNKVIEEVESRRRQGMTCMIIAHRLSNFRFVDNLIILQRGRVVESGTKLELLQRNGVYRELIDASRLSFEG